MKKRPSDTPDVNTDVWNDQPGELTTKSHEPITSGQLFASTAAPVQPESNTYDLDLGYDLEGLKTDFPTATDLAKFVFDETGYSLNFKGRSNELKYRVALDVLNGQEPPAQFLSRDNPYLDKGDLVPEEPLRPVPARDPRIAEAGALQNSFYSGYVPHPDAEQRAMDRKVDCIFRKYVSGMITFEVIGPLDQRPEGDKIDRFGRRRPEIIRWIDPRTGEQVAQLPDGTMTAQGRKIRAMMRSLPFNKTNHWDQWVDREFVSANEQVIENPWGN